MANITKIWLDSVSDGERSRHSLRIDWDNDRHQAVQLESLSAENVEFCLSEAVNLLRRERLNGEI